MNTLRNSSSIRLAVAFLVSAVFLLLTLTLFSGCVATGIPQGVQLRVQSLQGDGMIMVKSPAGTHAILYEGARQEDGYFVCDRLEIIGRFVQFRAVNYRRLLVQPPSPTGSFYDRGNSPPGYDDLGALEAFIPRAPTTIPIKPANTFSGRSKFPWYIENPKSRITNAPIPVTGHFQEFAALTTISVRFVAS